MLMSRTVLLLRSFVMILSFGLMSQALVPDDAMARAGGKRSFGQRSQPPASQPRTPPQQQPMQQAPGGGGFLKGMAGGLAGGLIGSMLFSSLGHASGAGGMGGSGGFGFIEIILIGGLAFLGYKLWKSRQNRYSMAGAGAAGGGVTMSSFRDTPSYASGPKDAGYFAQPSTPLAFPAARIDSDMAEDIFFRVQGAWTRRDIALLQDLAEPDVVRVFAQDLQELKQNRSINRLENISVRRVEIGETWTEAQRDLIRVHFTANLLDYTVDETTGEVKEGSSSVPVKFEETWIFAKDLGKTQWRLAGIEQD